MTATSTSVERWGGGGRGYEESAGSVGPRPRRQHESQARRPDEGCSKVNTNAGVENMQKPTYMENFPPKTHEGK